MVKIFEIVLVNPVELCEKDTQALPELKGQPSYNIMPALSSVLVVKVIVWVPVITGVKI